MAQQIIGDLVYNLKINKADSIKILMELSDVLSKTIKSAEQFGSTLEKASTKTATGMKMLRQEMAGTITAMNKLKSAGSEVEKTMSKAAQGTTNSWKPAFDLLTKAGGSFASIGGPLGKLIAQITGLTSGLSSIGGGFSTLLSAAPGLLGIATGIGLIAGALFALKAVLDLVIKGFQLLVDLSVKFVQGAINAYSSLQTTQIAYNALIGDNVALTNQLIDDIQRLAMISPSFTLAEGLDVGKRMMAMGTPPEDLVNTMRMLGDVAAATGAPLDRIALVFGQIQAAGKIMGNDWMQLKDAGIPIFEMIGDSIGKTAAEVMRMKEEGEAIDFETVRKAFEEATGEGGKFEGMMEKLGLQTIPGAVALIKDFGTILLQTFGAPIGEAILSVLQPIAAALVELSDIIVANKDEIAGALNFIFDPIKNIGSEVGSNIASLINNIDEYADTALDAAKDTWNAFGSIIDVLKEWWDIFVKAFDDVTDKIEEFGAVQDPIGSLTKIIEDQAEVMEDYTPTVELLAEIFAGLSSIVLQLVDVFAPLIELSSVLTPINIFLANSVLLVLNGLIQLVNWILENVIFAITDFINIVSTLTGQLVAWFGQMNSSGPAFSVLASSIAIVFGPLATFINLVSQAINALSQLGVAQQGIQQTPFAQGKGGAGLNIQRTSLNDYIPSTVSYDSISAGAGDAGGGGGGGESEAEKNAKKLAELAEKRADTIEKFNEKVIKSFSSLNNIISDSTEKFDKWFQETFSPEQISYLEKAENIYAGINKNIDLFGFFTETYTKSLDEFNNSLSDSTEEEERLETATKNLQAILDTADKKIDLVKEGLKDFEDVIKSIQKEYEDIIDAQDDYNKKLEELALEDKSPLTRAQVAIGNFVIALEQGNLATKDLYSTWKTSFDDISDALEQLTEDHEDMYGEINDGTQTVIEQYETAKEALEDWRDTTESLVEEAVGIMMDARQEIDDLTKDLLATEDYEKQQELLAQIREQEATLRTGEQFGNVPGFNEALQRAQELEELNPLERLKAEFEFQNQIKIDEIIAEKKRREEVINNLQLQIDDANQIYLDNKNYIESLQREITNSMDTELLNRENSTRASLDRIKSMYDQLSLSARSAFTGFASGGYTGDGSPMDIAGTVHKKEYVVPSKVVDSNPGLINALERMRLGGKTYNQTINNYNTISDGADAILLSNGLAWRLRT